MNIFLLVWNYLKAKPLNTFLNILLLTLGIAVITVLLLFNNQLQQNISENAKGIDLVVGAKGSPMQIILCNIFHIDFPTGNINLAEAEKFSGGRLIKKAIPLALGDSYQGYRIIGTSQDYALLYEAELSDGAWWQNDMEVVIGATVAEFANIGTGDRFASSHGLTAAGHMHEEQQFVVAGILKHAGNVLDNLILTNIESIWKVHEEHNEEAVAHEDHGSDTVAHNDELHKLVADSSFIPSPLVPSVHAGDSSKEITSLLIQYRSPIAAIQLPRIINAQTSMQAASPAFEMSRLFSILGVGIGILQVFAFVLVGISVLSIFIALYNSLKERRYDLAIMRSMGATRLKLFISVLMEGTTLTLLGSISGLLLAHILLFILSLSIEEVNKAGISGLVFYPGEWIILAGSLLLGVLCSFIPAIQAYRTDISKVLAG